MEEGLAGPRGVGASLSRYEEAWPLSSWLSGDRPSVGRTDLLKEEFL